MVSMLLMLAVVALAVALLRVWDTARDHRRAPAPEGEAAAPSAG